MAKQPAHFKAYSLDNRKKLHAIPDSAAKISQYRLRAGDWRVSKPAVKPAQKKRGAKGKKSAKIVTRAIKRPSDLLKSREDSVCLHCGSFSTPPSTCEGIKCLRAFRKQHFAPLASSIEIRGPSPSTGYGAFVSPGHSIPAGAYIGEYIGELAPLGTRDDSLYRIDIPGVCTIDAAEAGNWCRFVNSSCRPNVKFWADFVGGWHVVLFQALREIGEEEEVVFDYGRRYFERAGFECRCGVVKGPHLPGGSSKSKGKKR